MVKLNFLKQCHYLDVVKDRIAHVLTGHTYFRVTLTTGRYCTVLYVPYCLLALYVLQRVYCMN